MLTKNQVFSSAKESPNFLNFLSSFERKINDPAESLGVYESILNYLIVNPNIDVHQRFSSYKETRKKRMEIPSPLCLLARSFCFNEDMSVINSNKKFLLGKEPGLAYPDSLDKLTPEHFYTFKTETGESVFDFDSCVAVLMLMGMDPWEHSPNQQKNEIPETIQWLLARDAGRLLDLALKMPKAKTLNYDWATLMNAEIHSTLQTKSRRTWWDYACSVDHFSNYAGNVVEHCFKNNVQPEVTPKYTDYPLLGCHVSVLKLALDFGMIPLDEKFSQLFKKKWEQSQKILNISPQQFNEGISLLFQNHDNISTVDSLEQERIKGLIRFHILSKNIDHREKHTILHPDNIPFEDLNVQVPMTVHGMQGDWSPLSAALWYESLNKLSTVNSSFCHIAQCLGEYEGMNIDQGFQMVLDVQQQKINPYFSGLNLLSIVEPPNMFFSEEEESAEVNHQLKIETNRTLYPYLLEKLDMKNKRVEPSTYRLIERLFVHQKQGFYHDNSVFIGNKKQDLDFCLAINELIYLRLETEKSAKNKTHIKECVKTAFYLNEFLRTDIQKYISALDVKEQLDKYVQWFNYYLANKNLNPTITLYVENESEEHYKERTQARTEVMEHTLRLLEKKDGLNKSALIQKIEVMSGLVLDEKKQDDHVLLSKIKEIGLQQRIHKLKPTPSFSNTTISRF